MRPGVVGYVKGAVTMSTMTEPYKMYTTMHRQPADVRMLLAEGWESAGEAAARLADATRVFVVGIGTSFHAAQLGTFLLRTAGADARAVDSHEFATYPYALRGGDAVIVMAHKGTKTFSAAAVELASAAGVPVIGISGRDSKMSGDGPALVLRTVVQETSAAYTASHLGALTVLAQIATVYGERRGVAAVAGWRDALAALPDQVTDVLAREAEIEPVAKAIVNSRIYAIGAGPNGVTATEAALKAREAAYVTMDGMSLEQFLHGPMVTINPDDRMVVVAVEGAGMARTAQVANALHLIGTPLWVVGHAIESVPDAPLFALPTVPEPLSPLLTLVPVQLLAYYLALAKGTNPDTFRRDDPRYLTAFSSLSL
jgi:glucosamine--fructose-6-phosphate aminotransferase (isomerizing)